MRSFSSHLGAGLLLLAACDPPPATVAQTAPPAESEPDRARDAVTTAPTDAEGDGPKPAPGDRDGTQTLVDLEQRLLAAEEMSVEYEVESRGTFVTDVTGRLELQGDAIIEFSAQGDWNDAGFDRRLWVDEVDMTIRGDMAADTMGGPRTEGSSHQAALVLGLTRMGLTHNVARLVEMKHPDRYDGDPNSWVQADQVRLGVAEPHGDRELVPLYFHVVVDGVDSAEAILWVDPDTGLPVEREQTVDFGSSGSMTVVERYTSFDVIDE